MKEEKRIRCKWAENTPEPYMQYHDEEWGVPVHDDTKHFEFLILESAQAGLSWSTVIKRREAYRQAFAGFNPQEVANFGQKEIEWLLSDSGIIRNKSKILSAINNAGKFLEVQQEFGSFDKYIWSFVDGKPVINHWAKDEDIPAKTIVSDNLSYDLRKRGFTFVGSVIMYAHMQACGLVNDHIVDCFRHREVIDRIAPNYK